MKPRIHALALVACFLAGLLASMLMGAASPGTRQRVLNRGEMQPNIYLQIAEVGGCEYVVAQTMAGDGGVAVTHHAACTNPTHAK